MSTSAVGPTQPPIQLVAGAVSPGVKRKKNEAKHSPPSIAEVKNGGAMPPLRHKTSRCGTSYLSSEITLLSHIAYALTQTLLQQFMLTLFVVSDIGLYDVSESCQPSRFQVIFLIVALLLTLI
jgi:hypothetical protein